MAPGALLAVLLALGAPATLAGCGADPNALLLDVTAEDNALRLRVEVKGPATLAPIVEEFDVDPTGVGKDITDEADAFSLALRFAESGRYGVHIVDITGAGPPRQSWAAEVEVSGMTRGKAKLIRLGPGDDDDMDGWAETCPADAVGCLADCNDGDAMTNPFAIDVCEDGLDQDCKDGDRPCGDADGDGYPERCTPDDPASCEADCDDLNAEVNPGVVESSTFCGGVTERRCDDGVDDDCDGSDAVCHTDEDCDGFFPENEPGGNDCNDADPDINPDAVDLCDDGIDQDCDGTADDGCARCDEDGDGEFGQHPERGCEVAPEQRDCDDADRAVHHGATADCGGLEGHPKCAARGFCAGTVDEDCDGMVNEGCPPAACDADGDGYAVASCPTPPPAGAADCDDTNARVYPGAPDVCGNAVLENCSIDLPCTGDGDGDGFVAPADCNDGDAAVKPGAIEACNGKDDDCDGVIDEGNPGMMAGTTLDGESCTFDDDGQCGAGAPGRCVCSPTATDGIMDPTGDRTLCPGEAPGPFGARCFGAVQPTFEKCDALDWDCDERVDDPTGANLDPAELGQPCHDLPGPCVTGHVIGCDFTQSTAHFDNIHWVCSADQRGPMTETCNGVDDDCDGAPDDGFGLGTACDGSDGDFCNEGVVQCNATGGTECNDTTGTNLELCNLVDDDCDGQLNEGFPGLGSGCDGGDSDLCNEGFIVCNLAGDGTTCSDLSGNTVERCNNSDDDCDGLIDEDFPDKGQMCDGGDTDMCMEGTRVCNGMQTGTVCNDPAGENDVESCNNFDDDCDGMVDEDFPTLGQMCDGGDSDMCREGTVVCFLGAAVCSDNTGSTTETCNNVDDDCDMTTDEGAGPTCAPLGDTCAAGGLCRCGTGPTCSTAVADNCSGGMCRCGSGPTCNPMTSNNCTSGSCRCGSAPACAGMSDTCTGGQCRCGSGPACSSATADNCSGGVCLCGVNPACDTQNSNNCTGGMCRCGANPACTGLSDTCQAGTCRCGMGPACDPLVADNCSGGVCRCGNGDACIGGEICTMGQCG